MENLLLVLNIILAVILVSLILLQKSEGGALGIGVSQENFMLSRSAGSFITKATAIVATLFIICSLALTIISRGELPQTSSVLDTIEEKTEFIQMRIIGFGHVYSLIKDLPEKIDIISEKYNIDSSKEKEKALNKYIHSKSSLYGCIKYALRINITIDTIQKWYKEFKYDKNFIDGINPMELLIEKNTSNDDVQEKDKVSQVTSEV